MVTRLRASEVAVIALAIGTTILGGYVHAALNESAAIANKQKTYSDCVDHRRTAFLAVQAEKDTVENTWYDTLSNAEALPVLSPGRETLRRKAYADRKASEVQVHKDSAALAQIKC